MEDKEERDLDTLVKIFDILTAKMSRDRPTDETLRIIAERARKLYRHRRDHARIQKGSTTTS
jgi:hypothetical protein